MRIKRFNENIDSDGSRETTDIEKEVMVYLNDLRESGATNMYGATTYILEEFPDLEKKEASIILSMWMENFNEDGDYDHVKVKEL